MPEDIVNFLKEKRGGILIKSLNWWGPLRLRTLAFVAMQKGFFSFSEFCQLLLPSFFLPTRSKLMDRYYKFLCEESKREYPGTLDGCVNLFGHKFGGPDYREVIELTNEVVVLNQYHPDQFLLKDSIIIDAGANIGMFSALAAHIALYGHVYAFEPVEKTFQALKKNMEYYPQVICEKAGLGNKNLKKNIIVDSRGTAGSVFEDSPYYHGESNVGKNGKPELVQVIAIDDFIISHAIPRVDFIKIDTEGYEANILQGSKETIKKFHPVIAMSAYHNPSDKIELPKLLKSICPEYVCELYEKGGEDLICYIKS